MATIELEGDTLGQKQRNYNNIVRAATADDSYKLSKLNYNESDINNMLRIDVACNRRMVEYILEVLQCQDMLYVSRAIKGSVWLVSEEQYANIINPEYLNEELFPNMMIKAKHKLLASIQKNLKVSVRAEAFYNYYKDNFSVAQRWLRHCSSDFAYEIVINHADEISFSIIKHLCRKSSKILKCYLNSHSRDCYSLYKYLLQAEREDAMKILVSIYSGNQRQPKFRKRFTRSLMKRYPDDIITNFDMYYYGIHLSTFVKYIEKEDIENLLSKHIESDFMKQFFRYENLKHFLRYMPETKRLHFIEAILEQKENYSNSMSVSSLADLKGALGYRCYEFMQFDIAFLELQKLITRESSPYKRNSILSVLVSSARRDSQNILTILEYYQKNHCSESNENKVQFLNKLLTPTSLNKFNESIWSILDDVFTSMDFSADINKDIPKCFEVMIVYKLIHDIEIPEIFNKKVRFNSFIDYRSKLNADEQQKVLNYVFETCFTKSYKKDIVNEEEMSVMVNLITEVLILLKNWNKGPDDYPVVIDNIREIIKTKRNKNWDIDLTNLYKVHKSFMVQLHDELLVVYPSDETCFSALKHDASLLLCYKDEVISKCSDDSIFLRQTLGILRIYWSRSTIQRWVEKFLEYLQQPVGQEVLVKNLLILLPYEEAMSILIRKYAPDEMNSEHNNNVNSLRQNVARFLFLLRPSLVDEGDLTMYAKKEYYRYLYHSFNIILRNKSANEFWSIILVLLNYGPLHKQAIRMMNSVLKKHSIDGYHKMKVRLAMKLLDLLLREKNTSIALEVWDSFRKVYDDLLPTERKTLSNRIYSVTHQLADEPVFFIKIYTFLKDTATEPSYEDFIVNLSANQVFDKLDPYFVENEMIKIISEQIFKDNGGYGCSILSKYLLNCNCEQIQVNRYEKFFIPILERCFASWEVHTCACFWCNPPCSRHKFYTILESLAGNLIDSITKFKCAVPVRLFINIRNKLETVLNLEEELHLIMTWNMYVFFLEILNDNLKMHGNIFAHEGSESRWDTFCLGFVNSIGEAWFKYFKNVLIESASFHVFVSRVCLEVLSTLRVDRKFQLYFVKWLLTNNNEPLFYCIAIDILRNVNFYDITPENKSNDQMKKELSETIRIYPSDDVRWYYYHYENILNN